MKQENPLLMKRIENILKINCYDKHILKRNEIIKEIHQYRQIAKKMEPEVKSKKKQEI
jgi:hypothetical protein